MYSVLIADDNKQWLEILETRINNEHDFNVVAKAYDGKETIAQIQNFKPDIIILDIIMPEYDGAYIVNHIRTQFIDYKPIIYILSGIGTDTIIKILNDLEIDFYSMKPVSVEIVIESLRNIIKQQEEDSIFTNDSKVSQNKNTVFLFKNLVYRLGMSPNKLSTDCIIDALVFHYENPDSVRLLTKVLYPEVAKQRKVSVSSVEKNIRDAISRMKKNNTKLYEQIFSYTDGKKITNGEFISVVVDYIKRNANFY